MITILSPAKTLDMKLAKNTMLYTEPNHLSQAAELIEELRKYSPPELESLMKINNELAETNYFRHANWTIEHSLENSKQALLAYSGMVFQGLSANTLEEASLLFGQAHLRILSGLYGILKPLDLIQPYRLEMQAKLKNPKGKDLYKYWQETITKAFIEELQVQNNPTILNLASEEYSSVLNMKLLEETINPKIIAPVFKDYKNGAYKIITVYAKKARGEMARYILQNQIDNPDQLKNYNEGGYVYCEDLSSENEWTYLKSSF